MRLYSIVLLFVLLISQSVLVSANNQSIRIGIDLWPGYYPVILAKHLNLFKKRNLIVDIVLPEDTDNMLQDFTSGKLDLVCVAMGDAFSLKAEDPNLKVVMITDESAGGDALLGNPEDLSSLKGRKIGTNLDGFGELFVKAFLEKGGLSLNDVSLVHQEASDAIHFLQEGRADVVHTWEPYVTEVVSFNAGDVLFDSSHTPGLIPDSLLANGKTIRHNPKALRLFIEAWLEAVDWWLDHRVKGDSIIESELVLMPGSVNLEGVRLYTKNDNIEAFRLGQSMTSLHHVTNIYIDFFRKKGGLNSGLKSIDFLDSRFLPK
mgnify:CR=1 FL=1